jgi:hypothetical protein
MREISGSPVRAGRVRVPSWFARELALLDDRYYVAVASDGDYYCVVLDTEQLVNDEETGEIVKVKYPLIRAVFDEFDMRVIKDVQKRKWIGRHFRSNAHYYAWLKEQKKIQDAKDHETNIDMATEGYMKMDRMERTKTFNY